MRHEAAATASRPRRARKTIASGAERSRRMPWLLCRAGTRLCALPIEPVIETMRGLPCEPFAGVPPYVRGLSVIRGAPVPVIDIGLLVGNEAVGAARFVTVRVESRTLALAVEAVLGISALEADVCEPLSPILHDAAGEAIAAIGARDAALLVFLRTACIVPEDVFARLDIEGAVS